MEENREVNYTVYLESDYNVECVVLASVNTSVLLDERSGMPDELLGLVSADCFHNVNTRAYYNAIKKCRESGEVANLANITLDLGGNYADFVSGLISHATLPDIKKHCEKLRSLLAIREMTKNINRAYAILHDEKTSAVERVQKSQSFLSQTFVEVRESGSGGSFMSDRLTEYMTIKHEKMQGIKTGLMTGINAYDKDTGGMHGGELITCAALSGMGKTNFVLTIANNVSKNGFSPAIFSLEMSNEEITDRYISQRSKGAGLDIVSNSKLKNGKDLTQKNLTTISSIAEQIHSENTYVDDSSSITIQSICSQSRKLKADGKVDLIVVDYLQLLVEDENKAREEISNFTRTLKKLAVELDVPVIQLSQLNKRDCKKGERPNKGWLKGSGSIEADSDLIVFPWREQAIDNDQDSDASEAILIMGKVRGHHGVDGKMKFCTITTQFTDGKQSDF